MLDIGTFVTYVGATGHKKPALVVGNLETIDSSDELPAILDETAAHLLVFSPTGKVYTRYNVQPADDFFQAGRYIAA